jgi:hypothetical protein
MNIIINYNQNIKHKGMFKMINLYQLLMNL